MDVFVTRRGDGYNSVRDVWLRSGLDVDEIEKLAQADAFRSIGLDRRAALWQVRALDRKSAAETMPLFDRPGMRLRDNEPETKLPIMPPANMSSTTTARSACRSRRTRSPSCAGGWNRSASRQTNFCLACPTSVASPWPGSSLCVSAPARAMRSS